MHVLDDLDYDTDLQINPFSDNVLIYLAYTYLAFRA